MKLNLLARIGLPLVFPILLNFPFGCATIPLANTPTESAEPLSRQESLLNLGIPSRFHDYKEKFLKLPCNSKNVDLMMGGEPYQLHYYSPSGENNMGGVVEYFPFIEGVKSEYPAFYFFDLNGDGLVQENGEVFFDHFLDGLNGNESLLYFNNDELTSETIA